MALRVTSVGPRRAAEFDRERIAPALGIGDPERVNRIAARLTKGAIGAQATLRGKPVAAIDLARHGSIVQANS